MKSLTRKHFLIGQRVIVGGLMIATIIKPPKDGREDRFTKWVRLPDGVEQWRDIESIEPLPNGQL